MKQYDAMPCHCLNRSTNAKVLIDVAIVAAWCNSYNKVKLYFQQRHCDYDIAPIVQYFIYLSSERCQGRGPVGGAAVARIHRTLNQL